MNNLTKKLVNGLIFKGIIKKEDREIYEYGFKQMLFIILNLLTVLIIGIIFNKVFESILFMITYIPIRIYAGGYHSRTYFKCYIFSLIMLVLVLYILKTQIIINTLIPILTISSLIILLLAPVEDKNKPLDDIEIKVYKKRAIRNLIIILILFTFSLILNNLNIASCICVSLLCNGIMLIIGKLNNIYMKYYKKI